MIEYLERANLFIVPLDVERRWYRYHRLFADVLRLRLRQLHPELVAPIHRRAAAWYRRSGLPTDAIQHALAAQDWDAAAEYIEESAEALLMRGEVTTLVGWIRTLPRDVLHNRPRLSLFYAAALVVIGQLDEADVYVRIAEQASEAKQTPSADSSRDDALAAGELDTIKAVVAGSRGDLSVAIACAHAALEQLPQERRLFRLAATMILGADAWMRGETNQTLQFIEAQLALHAPSGNELLHAWANMLLIYVQCSQGKLRLAAQTGWRLLAPNADRSGVSSLTAGVAAARLSEISYEWNDLEAAVRFARDGIAQSRRFGSPEQESFNSAALALALQAQGDAAGARTAIEQAVKLVQPQPIERAVVATYQVRLWLAQGDLASAVAWAQACAPFAADKIQYVRVVQQLTLARVYLAQGGAAVTQAIMLLVPLVREAESHEQFGQAIEAYALLALAHTAGDDATQAIDCLARALELAAPEGYIRLFADLGAPMAGLLRQARARGITPGYVQKLLASFSRTEGRGLRTDSPESVHVMLSPQSSTLVEPLSARELEVLRLIAAGQPNGAIAQTLIIAESTVKMHLKNIYGKLDAHSRTQAIARARAVGLL